MCDSNKAVQLLCQIWSKNHTKKPSKKHSGIQMWHWNIHHRMEVWSRSNTRSTDDSQRVFSLITAPKYSPPHIFVHRSHALALLADPTRFPGSPMGFLLSPDKMVNKYGTHHGLVPVNNILPTWDPHHAHLRDENPQMKTALQVISLGSIVERKHDQLGMSFCHPN